MKTFVSFVSLIFALLLPLPTMAADITNYLCAKFDQGIIETLRTIIPSRAEQIVLVEGEHSFEYSSARGEPDYFLLPTPLASGGRLLSMSPLHTSDHSPSYGTVDTVVKFTDVISKETFTVEIVRNQNPATGQITNRGTLVLDGKDFYVLIDYRSTPRYPRTTITWGIGAKYGDVGIVVDNMICPQQQVVIPENKIVQTHQVRVESGVFGTYFVLARPLHAGNQIESSIDRLNWVRLKKADLLVSGDGRNVFYHSVGKEEQFFRMVNSE